MSPVAALALLWPLSGAGLAQVPWMSVDASRPEVSTAAAASDAWSHEAFAGDLARLAAFRACLSASSAHAASDRRIFPAGEGLGQAGVFQEFTEAARAAWGSAMDCFAGLDALVLRYGAAYAELGRPEPRRRAARSGEGGGGGRTPRRAAPAADLQAAALAAAQAAYAAQARWIGDWYQLATFVDVDGERYKVPELAAIFDAAVPALGLPAGTYSKLTQPQAKPGLLGTLDGGEAALRRRSPLPALRKALRERGAADFMRALAEDSSAARRYAGKAQAGPPAVPPAPWLAVAAPARAWGAAPARSTAPACRASTLVSEAGRGLRPGDLLLVRRDPLEGEPGLGGYWTDVAIYIGTLQERVDSFGPWERFDPGKAVGGGLRRLWRRLRGGDEAVLPRPKAGQGAECRPRVVEVARRRGRVVTLEAEAEAEALAALRPVVDAARKARAVRLALDAAGLSGEASPPVPADPAAAGISYAAGADLVRRAYAGRGAEGDVMEARAGAAHRKAARPGAGRPCANDLARRFDEEYGFGRRRLEFVFFLDRRAGVSPLSVPVPEGGKVPFDAIDRKELYRWLIEPRRGLPEAHEAGPEELRRSWRRPKWAGLKV